MEDLNRTLCAVLVLVFYGFLAGCSKEKVAERVPIEKFFMNPDKTAFALSPDGESLAYLQPFENRLNLFVQELRTNKVKRITSHTDRNIGYFFWANNEEILYLKDRGDDNPRLYAVDKNGLYTRDLIPDPKIRLNLINIGRIENNEILIALNKRDSTVFDPYRLNIRTRQMEMIAKNPGNIVAWIADAYGKLRVAISSDQVNETIWYRANEQEEFRAINTNNFKSTVSPVGFTEDGHLYVLSNLNRDKMVLAEFDVNSGSEKRIIYSHPEVDVLEASYSKTRKKLMFAVFETWKRERHFLDEQTKDLFEGLERKFPDSEVRITDRDSAENKFIIRTFTDRNPGVFYLYNRKDDRLTKLAVLNSALSEADLSEMKPISYKSRDGLTIHGYLTLPRGKGRKNLPVVVLPHGGPSARNSWGFNSEVQFLANRGYAVFQMNYRGSLGYGKAFWSAGFKEWGGKMQEDITDGVKWLIAEGIADSSRIAIYGSSFGGFSALYGLTFHPELYACGVSYAGLVNLFSYLKGIPAYYRPVQQMMYEMVGDPVKDAAYFQRVSPVFNSEKIKDPVMIAQGAKDSRVNVSEINQYVKDLRKRGVPVTYMLKENEGHFFRNQENRQAFYQELERFLDQHLNKKQ